MTGPKYLVDSVVVIDHLNGHPAASEFLRTHSTECAISVITRAETLSGCEEENTVRTKLFLDRFPTIHLDDSIAEQAARFRRQYRWKLLDAFQAAIVQAHSLMLVTRNTKDFPPERHPFVKVPYRL